jgi:hypothetical protein
MIERERREGRDGRTICTWGYIGLAWGGHLEEADRMVELILDYLPTLPPETQRSSSYRNVYAWFIFSVGDVEAAERMMASLVEDNPDNRNYRAGHAIMAAGLGDTLTARETLRWLEQFDRPYDRGAGYDLRAQVEAHLGNLDEAVRMLEIAVERGAWPVWFRYPMFRPLWEHPGFIELMRPKG